MQVKRLNYFLFVELCRYLHWPSICYQHDWKHFFGVEGTDISNLVVHVTDCSLQFNHNYTMTMQVGEGDRSVLRLGDLSMLPFIG